MNIPRRARSWFVALVTVSTALAQAPVITMQPQSQTVTAGQPATFSVSATGGGALTYQWRRNGLPLSGATGSSYSIPSTTRLDADYYDVQVSDGALLTTSTNVRLSVAPTSYPTSIMPDPAWDLQLEAPGGTVYATLPLSDGRFYVAGEFTSTNGIRSTMILRANADGTRDATFTSPEIDDSIWALGLQSDGKIIIGGEFTKVAGAARGHLARLNSNGSEDSTFNAGNGASGTVYALSVSPDDRIIVGGNFSTLNSASVGRLARLNSDGSLDETFNSGGLGANGTVYAVAQNVDGRVIAGGAFTSYNGSTANRLVRLTVDGQLDTSFVIGTGPSSTVYAVVPRADGSVYIGGDFTTYDGSTAGRMARVASSGVLDTSFSTSSVGINGSVRSISVQSDGRLVIGGGFNNSPHGGLMRLNTSGTRDFGFTSVGIGSPASVYSVAQQSTGQLLVGGTFTVPRIGFLRAGANGGVEAVDLALRINSIANVVIPLPTGKTIVAGGFGRLRGSDVGRMVRLNSDSSIDSSFNPGGTGADGAIFGATLLSDGRIAITGDFTAYNGVARSRIAVLNADGSVNTSFNPTAGGLSSAGFVLAALSGGRLGVGGTFTTANGASRNRVAVFSADGSLDPSFDAYTGTTDGAVYVLAQQADGKLIVGGSSTLINGSTVGRIARLNANGAIDATFNAGGTGANDAVFALALQPDGKILLAGGFSNFNGTSRNAVARLNTSGALDTTFVSPFSTSDYNLTELVWQENNTVLVRGYHSVSRAASTATFSRITAAGAIDGGFTALGFSALYNTLSMLAVRENGQLLTSATSGIEVSFPAFAPTITSEPVSQIATVGGSATFSVAATGSAPLRYQWHFGGSPITGATNSTLTIANAQSANGGSYSVVVRNALGSVSSTTVTLSGTNPVPTISTAPQNSVVISGQPASLTVVATGAGALTYQWRRNGVSIAGATINAISIPTTTRADADYYDVRIADGLSVTTSVPVRLSVAPTSYPSVVSPDPAWNLNLEVAGATVYATAPLADGRFYVAGDFLNVNGVRSPMVFRANADGTFDPTFVPPEIDGAVRALALQSDGKLVIGGDFTRLGNTTCNRITRLNSDGTNDSGFTAGAGASSTVQALAIQNDGKIVVGGGFASFNGNTVNFIVRLNTNGTIDTSFNSGGTGASSSIYALLVQPDQKLIIGGFFSSFNGNSSKSLARLNADGTFDSTFNVGSGASSAVYALARQTDGSVLLGGAFTSFNGTSIGRLARVTSTGTLDSTFAVGSTGFNLSVYALAVQADGRVLVGGNFSSLNGVTCSRFTRLSALGSRDSSIDGIVVGLSLVYSVGLQPDGRILVGGDFSTVGSLSRTGFARIDSNNTLDSAANFALRQTGFAHAIVPSTNGKTVVTGSFSHARGAPVAGNILRLTSAGNLDSAFNPGGTGANGPINAAIALPDGRIALAGSFTNYNGVSRNRIAVITADGLLDSNFNPAGGLNGTAYTISAYPGGRFLVAGSFSTANGATRNDVALFSADGALVTTFDPGLGADQSIYTSLVQTDGKVVLGGLFTSFSGASAGRIVRLNSDGTRDNTFNVGTGASFYIYASALQPDGKILLGGTFSSFNGVARKVVRLNADGSVDSLFAPSVDQNVYGLLVQEDGKVIVRGSFGLVGGAPGTEYLARFNADGSRDPSFFADGFYSTNSVQTALLMRDNGQLLMSSDFAGMVGTQSAAAAPLFTTQPVSQAVAVGWSVTFTAVASGLPAPMYQWKKGGIDIAGETGATLTLTNVQTSSAGSYTVVASNGVAPAATSNAAILTVNVPPAITTHPASQTVAVGANVNFTVVATGTPAPTLQWRKGGVVIPGATNATLSLTNVQATDAGNYTVVASNGVLPDATSNTAVLTVNVPPAITTEPQSQSVLAGGNVSFTVAATGTPSPTYQWRLNGTNLAGATNATLAINNVQVANLGSYIAVVTNSVGSVTSAAAMLSASNPPPTIAVHPANTSITVGQSANFSVTATGVGTLTYQWRRHGYPITGATGANYSLSSVGQSDASSYDVVVTDGLTSTTSNSARLGVAPPAYPGALKLDSAFNLDFENDTGGQINAVVSYSANQFIVVGDFIRVAGNNSIRRVARINADDGSLDLTFAVNINHTVNSVFVQADGKVVIGGAFTLVNGVPRTRIARLNANGSVDEGFDPGSGAANSVLAIVGQPDGKLVLGGGFNNYNGTAVNRLVRINSDGSRDTNFTVGTTQGVNNSVNALALDPATGKILAGGAFTAHGGGASLNRIARFNPDGTLDVTFDIGTGFDNTVNALGLDPTGSVVVGGAFTSYKSAAGINRLVRLTASGAVDASFAIGAGANGTINTVTYDAPANRWLIGGGFTSFHDTSANSSITRNRVARLSATGALDSVFNPNVANTVNSIFVQPAGGPAGTAGMVVFGGLFSTVNGNVATRLVARVAALDGARDAAINIAFRASGAATRIAPLPGGKLFVAGTFTHLGATASSRMVVLNSNLTVATVFNATGGSGTGPNGSVNAAEVQGDGKIVIGGSFTSYNGTTRNRIARLNPDFSLDATFNPGAGANSTVNAVALIPGGGLYVGGAFATFAGTARAGVARLTGAGVLDTAFNAGSAAFTVNTLALQLDAKVIAGGAFTSVNGQTRNNIVRFNPDGSFDSAFPAAGTNDDVRTVVLQPDERILLGGDFTSYNGTTINRLVRLNAADGSLDTSFAIGTTLNNIAYAIRSQEDAKLLIFGIFTTSYAGTSSPRFLGRIESNGVIDTSLSLKSGSLSINSQPSALHLLDDGSVLLGTNSLSVAGLERTGLIHLVPATPALIASFSPSAVRPGDVVTITGSNFLDVSAVRFNGLNGIVATNFTVNSPASITVTVPLGAVSGPIAVQTSSGDVVSSSSLSIAPDFQLRNPGTTAGSFESGIAYGNGMYVAATLSGAIWTSPDGITWTQRYSGADDFGGVAFGAGQFVVVGNGGMILTSSDGVAWSQRAVYSVANLTGVVHDGSKWLVVSSSTPLLTSTDAVNWTVLNSVGGGSANDVSFGAGLFVSVGNTGVVRTSPDGTTWTTQISGTTNNLNGVSFVNGLWVAVGSVGTVLTSPDGVTWTSRSSGTTSALYKIAFGANRFVIGGVNLMVSSTDGITWTTTAMNDFRSVVYGGGQFVGAGFRGSILTSPDGAGGSWILRQSLERRQFRQPAYGDGRFVAVATNTNGSIASSTDGVSWSLTNNAAGTSAALNGITYGNGLFVAVGINAILTTNDGMTWVNRSPAGSYTLNGTAYGLAGGAHTYVAVGSNGTIYHSVGGVSWSPVAGGPTETLNHVDFGAGTFVAVGATGGIFTSPDGTTWTSRISGTSSALNSVRFTNGRFVAVGSNSTVLTSLDGVTWAVQNLGTANVALAGVAFGDGYYVTLSTNVASTVWLSTDTVTWTKASLSPDVMDLVTTLGIGFGNGRFVAVGGSGWIVSTNPATDSTQIAIQPTSVAINFGQTTTLSVTANGAGLSYQWYQGFSGDTSTPVAGANGASLITAPITQTRTYWVRVTGTRGSVDSATATVTYNGVPPAITLQPQSVVASTGTNVTFTVAASGTPTPTLQWRKNGNPIAGATNSSFTLNSVATLDAGTYTVVATNVVNSTTSNDATLTVNLTSALRAFTLRGKTGPGAAMLNGTFLVEGMSKPILLRALGPGLVQAPYGTLVDPQLEVRDRGGATVALNNNWGAAANSADIVTTATAVGATPLAAGSADAAILSTFAPGAYAFRASGADNAAGHVGFELFEASAAPRIVHLAARGHAGAGAEALVAGLVVAGAGPRTFLVRAIGPSLGVPGALGDSKLQVFQGVTLLAENDDWAGAATLQTASAQVGASAVEVASKDAALLITLTPGVFTVNVTGVGGAAGLALLEVFEVDVDRPATIPTVVVSHPADVVAVAGTTASFKVITTGRPAATYQWRKDGSPLAGATNNSLAIGNVQRPGSLGQYDVVVSDGGTPITSNAASLNVLPAEILALSPESVASGSPDFVLTVTGAGFTNGSTVLWNGAARTTTFGNATTLTAAIAAADVAATNDIKTAVVTVRSPALEISNAKSFTILPAAVSTADSDVAAAGSAVTVTTAPSAANTAGVTVVLENSGGTSEPAASIAVATYTSNAAQLPYFDAGGGYVDVQVTGADATDKATAYFYYPNTVTGATETDVALLYFDGVDWKPVVSSGGVVPVKNTTDNLDGTVSGGRFSVVFDNTSTPKLTDLSGTVITTSFLDQIAPVITSITATPNVLDPPNHKLVPIVVTVAATDDRGLPTTSQIVAVTCNEAVKAPGSGNTDPDWRITGPLTVEVRSERAGTLSDRVYTITVETRDVGGNTTRGITTVTVPKGS